MDIRNQMVPINGKYYFIKYNNDSCNPSGFAVIISDFEKTIYECSMSELRLFSGEPWEFVEHVVRELPKETEW